CRRSSRRRRKSRNSRGDRNTSNRAVRPCFLRTRRLHMFRRFLIALLIVLPLTASAAPLVDFDTKPRPGIDYEILPTPQPTFGQGKIEVAEVFSYACIHCSEFQPLVDNWLKSLPKEARYEYVPAPLQSVWENFARGFFAAKILG